MSSASDSLPTLPRFPLTSEMIRWEYPPLRTLADIEAIEKTPLEQRITRWDFAQNLLDGCRLQPDRAAIHATHLGDLDGPLHTWTFADLERHSIQIANLLRARGIGAEDAVAIIGPTVPAMFAMLIGGMLAARPFPINWMLDAPSLRDLIVQSGAKAVVALGPTPGFEVWEHVQQAVEPLLEQVQVLTVHDPFGPAHPNDLLGAASEYPGDRLSFDRPAAQRHSVACYVHSGGTTGHPKIVRILHGGMVFRQWAASLGLAFTPHDVVLSDTPLFHIGGLLVRGLVSTADGHTTIIPSMHGARDKTYIANYWRYVERFGITQISGVPTTLSVLAKNPPSLENIASLRPFFATGSTAMAPSIQDRIEEITGARTLQSYGLTENTSHATLDLRDGEIRRGCSGVRVPYVQVRIVKMTEKGDIERDCAVNEIGMVVLRGPGIAGGYVNVDHNQGVFLPDGSLVTGDLGSLDAEGFIRISGRQKDLIIRGGHNIEPRLIEDALLQCPAVALAAAVGKPDAHAGELPVAYVQLHPGASITEQALLAFAAAHIPERPAVPKDIVFLDRLPLTAVGKPQKHLLQIDAAERVFRDVLQAVTGDWSLKVESSGGGLLLTVTLKGGDMQSRRQVDELLSAYAVRYTVEMS
jgi:fatty-acyl-CoA synthase